MTTKQKEWDRAMYEGEIASVKDELEHLDFEPSVRKELLDYIQHLNQLITDLDNE